MLQPIARFEEFLHTTTRRPEPAGEVFKQPCGAEHRNICATNKTGMGFGSFNTARRTLRGFEAMNMIRKGFLALTKAMYKHQFSWYLNFWNCPRRNRN